MCTLVLLYKVLEEYPIIALQNRYAERGSAEIPPMTVRSGKLTVYCPLDARGRGTWIGFNEAGLFVAITDQHTPGWQKGKKSRGLLALSILGECVNAKEALSRALGELPQGYRKCNFIIADFEQAYHLIHDEKIFVLGISPGVYVVVNITPLPNMKLDDTTRRILEKAMARRLRALELARRLKPRDVDEVIRGLMALAADHAYGRSELSICYHDDGQWFMSSSTIVAICRDIRLSKIFYCDGNACERPFIDFSHIVTKS